MQADIIAGMTVGIMVVPQAISYASLAGLPSRYGLHGAFIPVFVYAMYGSSRQLVCAFCTCCNCVCINNLSSLDKQPIAICRPSSTRLRSLGF